MLARAANTLLWYVVPALVVLAVAGYIAGATFGHANPPVVPVAGVSMRPALQAGDLVFLEGVDPKTLRKGDVVAVNVPSDAQQKYNLPAHIVHRIVEVGHDQQGLVFTTKGDANAGPDVFVTHASGVVGKLWFKATGLGYPFLFFRSRQGEIFLGAAALIAVLYFGLGLVEDRRITVEGTAATMQTVLEETQVLKDAITRVETLRTQPPPAGGVPPVVTPWGVPVRSPELDDLVEEVRDANARSRETAEVMRELVGAIGEYGTHLKSHTEVMVNLAATTGELQTATAEMRDAIAGGARPAAPAEPAPAPTPIPPAAALPAPPPGNTPPELPLKRSFRGYARGSVESLLAGMAQRVDETERRLADLEQSNARLQAERDRLAAEAAAVKQLEQTLTESLSRAEQTAAEIGRRAERAAERILDAARTSAAETLRRSTGDSAQQPAETERVAPGEHAPATPGDGSRRRPDDIGECVYLPE